MKIRMFSAWIGGATLIQILLSGVAVAEEAPRVWTDVKGRKIEAALLAVETDKIRVMLKGKEVTIPLENLSEADRKYVEDWDKNSDDADSDDEAAPAGGGAAKPAPGSAMFGDKPLVTGGKVNVYDFDYTAEALAELVKKHDAEDTGYKIGVAVPTGFDPSKPQKVFVVMSPGNNAGQMTAGNIRSLGQFAQRGVDEGWVCIAYNSNLGLPTTHYGGYHHALDKLLEIWPGMRSWTIATGGISGGAKGALLNVCLLTSKGLPARGLFLQGCNSAANLAAGRDRFKVSKGDLRAVRCFVSTGTKDPLVSAAQAKGVVTVVKSEGIKTIREETYEGAHELNLDQFATALEWFLAPES